MFKERFSIFIFIRVMLILAICLAFAFLFARTDYFFSQIILLVTLILFIIELIWYTRRTSREISRFLTAIKHGDVTQNFDDHRLGRNFRELAESFRSIIQDYNSIKIDKEAQFQLLQVIVDKISFGIFAYDLRGEILLMNHTAAELLGIPKVNHWDYIQSNVPSFAKEIETMASEGNKLIELILNGEQVQLKVNVHGIVILEKMCRVITIQDIKNEIEQKEIEAWYKLIRVLTHEIMNSVTPLGSLTDTILMLLEDDGVQKSPEKISSNQIADVRSSVKTIQKRSEGILQFVEDYRKLTNIPHPELEWIDVMDLFQRTNDLLKSDLEKHGIGIELSVLPEDLKIQVDRNLFEQVFINLMTNSMYALSHKKNPLIKLSASREKAHIEFSVEDNGKGIDESKIDKIFIPFYSTREGGSGVGLSFSKHVVYLHHGRIKVDSIPGQKTTFTINIPQNKE